MGVSPENYHTEGYCGVTYTHTQINTQINISGMCRWVTVSEGCQKVLADRLGGKYT